MYEHKEPGTPDGEPSSGLPEKEILPDGIIFVLTRSHKRLIVEALIRHLGKIP
jgi:hypothetical protein